MKKQLSILLIITSFCAHVPVHAVDNKHILLGTAAVAGAGLGYWYWQQKAQRSTAQDTSIAMDGIDTDCNICYENEGSSLPCHPTHRMCETCAKKWFLDEKKNDCPTCRAIVDKKYLRTIFKADILRNIATSFTRHIARPALAIGVTLAFIKRIDPSFDHTKKIIWNNKIKLFAPIISVCGWSFVKDCRQELSLLMSYMRG